MVSVGSYASPLLRRGIHWLKFKGVKGLAEPLAQLLIARLTVIAPLAQLQNEAVLVPVPLHRRRMRERGFNQSLELARAIEYYTQIPVVDVLSRRRSTWTQKKLPEVLRRDNVSGAFTISNTLPDKHWWLIVDDVTTTGATLSAAAAPLQAALTQIDSVADAQIWGATIARG